MLGFFYSRELFRLIIIRSIVRFGNVFGSQGSAIETFVDQILNKKKITITSYNMKRYFMSIREACNLVIQSAALGFKNKIFILDMGKQIKIINLLFSLLFALVMF